MTRTILLYLWLHRPSQIAVYGVYCLLARTCPQPNPDRKMLCWAHDFMQASAINFDRFASFFKKN